jgi:DNA repair protein RecO (recombination protein O)
MKHDILDAIILKSEKFKEKDKIIRLLTTKGKINCIVKGIRKTAHKYCSNLEIFSKQKIFLCKSKTNSLSILTNAKILDSNYMLRQDIEKFTTACMVIELIDTMIPFNEEFSEDIFELVNKTLTYIETEKKDLLISWFFLQLLNILGYKLEFDECIICSKNLSNKKIILDPRRGGVLCDTCFKLKRTGYEIEYNTYRVLKGLASSSDYKDIKDKCEMLKIEREKDVYRIITYLMEFFCEKKLNSMVVM